MDSSCEDKDKTPLLNSRPFSSDNVVSKGRPDGRPLLLFDEVFSNFLVFGKAPRRQLRIDQRTVQADFKAAAVGGNPYQPLDPGLEFGDARVGRTDRPGFIVSSLTINEFYLHNLLLPVCGSLQNDASIAASFRLSGRGAHSLRRRGALPLDAPGLPQVRIRPRCDRRSAVVHFRDHRHGAPASIHISHGRRVRNTRAARERSNRAAFPGAAAR